MYVFQNNVQSYDLCAQQMEHLITLFLKSVFAMADVSDADLAAEKLIASAELMLLGQACTTFNKHIIIVLGRSMCSKTW